MSKIPYSSAVGSLMYAMVCIRPDIAHVVRVVIVTQEYYTLVPPALGFRGRAPKNFFLGCVLANSFADPWYWVKPRIFPLYFPYKRNHCKMTKYGMVLYCIGRETVRA